jgi:hypothetical protein
VRSKIRGTDVCVTGDHLANLLAGQGGKSRPPEHPIRVDQRKRNSKQRPGLIDRKYDAYRRTNGHDVINHDRRRAD